MLYILSTTGKSVERKVGQSWKNVQFPQKIHCRYSGNFVWEDLNISLDLPNKLLGPNVCYVDFDAFKVIEQQKSTVIGSKSFKSRGQWIRNIA